MNDRQLVEFFTDASSDDARAFAIAKPGDEEFVRATIAEIDAKVVPADAPHALKVLAFQARALWVGKLPGWDFAVSDPAQLGPQYLRPAEPDEVRIREEMAAQLSKAPAATPALPGVVFRRSTPEKR